MEVCVTFVLRKLLTQASPSWCTSRRFVTVSINLLAVSVLNFMSFFPCTRSRNVVEFSGGHEDFVCAECVLEGLAVVAAVLWRKGTVHHL